MLLQALPQTTVYEALSLVASRNSIMFLQSNMMDRLDLENQTFNPLLVLPVVLSAAWILWDFFYVSYLLAFLVKLILNLFLKESGIHIGEALIRRLFKCESIVIIIVLLLTWCLDHKQCIKV